MGEYLLIFVFEAKIRKISKKSVSEILSCIVYYELSKGLEMICSSCLVDLNSSSSGDDVDMMVCSLGDVD